MKSSGKNRFELIQQQHEEESLWLVSYADMMTLLLGFFVILFVFSQVDKGKLSEVGKELTKTFGESKVQESREMKTEVESMSEVRQMKALQLLIAVLNLGDSVEAAVQNIEKSISSAKNAEAAKDILLDNLKKKSLAGYEVLKNPKDPGDVMEIAIPVNTLFTPGSDILTQESKQKLKELTQSFKKIDGLVRLEVIGHTDSQPLNGVGNFKNNWSLSSARAGAVAQQIIEGGFERTQIAVSGMADLKPLYPEKNSDGTWNKENMAKNRRVHIVVKRMKYSVSH